MTPGTKLGPYEILALIGKGGMGEVYRARDTQLKRDVALKVLPEAFARDPERMARFQREAEVLASLNHPNIAAIYGLAEADGLRALVMELVEGESPKGPMPFEDAWKIAMQMADALEYAHEKGVIHRDLKPANVKVTPDGVVKLLDFGLAKAMSAQREPSANPENSPTLTIGATEAGVVLGTAAYMAPEQARGKGVDKRGDIWSWGVVLYELLTGERMFKGDEVADTLAQVLTKEPDLERVPAKVRRLLRRCLEKDPKQRLRDIGDARHLLEDEAVSAGQFVPKRHLVTWIGLSAVFAFAAVAFAFVHFREAPPTAPVINTTLLPPEGGEFDFGNPYALPALSPDGTRIVFGAKPKDGMTQLWLRRLDSPTAQPLPGTDGAEFPFWSPDSRWVGFGQGNTLKKIDIEGGPPVTLTDLKGPLRGGSWSPAGVIVFAVNDAVSPLLKISPAGGTAAPATVLEPGNERNPHAYPWFLPDGRHFLYTNRQNGDIPVRVGSLDEPGMVGKVVAQAHSNAIYAQGYLLYLRENTLMAQPFDLDRMETKGEAVPVAEGVPTFPQPSRGAGFTVSASGLLAYQSVTAASILKSQLLWKDRQGKTLGTVGEPLGLISGIALSPDGRRLAADIQDRTGNRDIWIYDVGRGVPTRFTFDPAIDQSPVWSPDGNTLYFRRSPFSLFRKASNGAGSEELLLGDSTNKFPVSLSPDGRLLLYRKLNERVGLDLWALPLTAAQAGGKPEPRLFLPARARVYTEFDGKFSPDGQWVAYVSDESGQREVYAVPFPGPGGKRQISSGGGTQPRWRRDGKEIFYATLDGRLMAAEVAARNGTLEVGRVQKLFDGIVSNNGTNLTYDVSPDGQRFIVVDNGGGTSPPLTLLQNWTASLRK